MHDLPEFKSLNLNKRWGKLWQKVVNALRIDFKFHEIVRKFIRKQFIKGITQGEKDTGVQVGYRREFNPYIDALTNEQVNGYVLANGERWFGIKGVNEEIQRKLFNSLKKGLSVAETIPELQKRVKDLFSNFSDFRSMTIARTEATRIINQGINMAYVTSGVPGKKQWVSTLDGRTSDVCNRLNRQLTDKNGVFLDPKTGTAYYHPPAHPNCRSRIVFVPAKGGS